MKVFCSVASIMILYILGDRMYNISMTDRENFIKTHIYLNDVYYRNRPILQISNRYQETKVIHRRLLEGSCNKCKKEAIKEGSFWGLVRGTPKIYIFEKDDYNSYWIGETDYKLKAQIADPVKLPLMVMDPACYYIKEYISKIFRGELQSIPKKQDLVDKIIHFEARFRHIFSVRYRYLNLLKYYVSIKFHDQIYEKRCKIGLKRNNKRNSNKKSL